MNTKTLNILSKKKFQIFTMKIKYCKHKNTVKRMLHAQFLMHFIWIGNFKEN